MSHQILLNYFNTFGITSLKDSTFNGKITLKNSNFHAILNCLKVFILFYYKNSIIQLLNDCSIVKLEIQYSSFSNATHSINGNILMLSSFANILIQLWKKKETVKLLNDILKYKNLSIKSFKLGQLIYQKFKRNCSKDFLILLIVFGVVFSFDFLSTMKHNWLAFVSYILYILPEIINISMIVFIHIATQFVVNSHKILNNYLCKRCNENNIEQYAVHTKEIFNLLRQILKLITLQCIFVTCYMFMETLVQVSFIHLIEKCNI